MRPLVVIPSYGSVATTHAVVADLRREAVDITVIDNGGDYTPLGEEDVYRPPFNLGWLGACNLGMFAAFTIGHRDHVLLLNNDVRLSRGFVAGLVYAAQAHNQPAVGLVGPLENTTHPNGQRFLMNPQDFVPYPEILDTTHIHGASILVTRDCYRALGPFDENQQPFGWGVDIEYGYLARQAGFRVVISKYSYQWHEGQHSVLASGGDKDRYFRLAAIHTHRVFAAKYGPQWADRLGCSWWHQHQPPVTAQDELENDAAVQRWKASQGSDLAWRL